MASIAGIYELKTKPGRLIVVLTDINAERKKWMIPEGKKVGHYKCLIADPVLKSWIWDSYVWDDKKNRPKIGPLARSAGKRSGMDKLSKEDEEYIIKLAKKYIWLKK
jgi:hypothetical protein